MKKINISYLILMSVTCSIICFVSVLTYQKRHPEQTVFGVDLNAINQKIDDLFTIEKKEEISYIPLSSSHSYKTNDNQVPALLDGVVICNEGGIFAVTYKGDITAYYKNLLRTYYEVGDTFLAGDILGIYEQSFRVIFMKENEEISYGALIHQR